MVVLQRGRADCIRNELASCDEPFIAPHLIDAEVLSPLRKLVAGQRIDAHRSRHVFAALEAFPAERYSHTPLIGFIWELRHNFAAYDAEYIELAEAIDSVLYTCNEKLRKGHRVRVALVTTSWPLDCFWGGTSAARAFPSR